MCYAPSPPFPRKSKTKAKSPVQSKTAYLDCESNFSVAYIELVLLNTSSYLSLASLLRKCSSVFHLILKKVAKISEPTFFPSLVQRPSRYSGFPLQQKQHMEIIEGRYQSKPFLCSLKPDCSGNRSNSQHSALSCRVLLVQAGNSCSPNRANTVTYILCGPTDQCLCRPQAKHISVGVCKEPALSHPWLSL